MATTKAKRSKAGKYKGEITLLGEKYPVTSNGKLDCKRVSSAKAYGTMHSHIAKLKKAGLGKYAKQCGFTL